MKKVYIALASSLLVVGGVSALTLNNPTPTKAIDSPIVQQVQHQQEELGNHDARITNTENDVKDLQAKTSTPPSSTRVIVKEVTTPATVEPLSTASPTVVTTASYELGGEKDGFCKLVYSDNTVNYIKAVTSVTDNLNGSQSTSDNCKDYLGQLKS